MSNCLCRTGVERKRKQGSQVRNPDLALAIFYTLHPAPYTLHPAPYTLHPTPYTLHPTPYILHPTPYTLHPAPYTLHPSPFTNSNVHEHPIKSIRVAGK